MEELDRARSFIATHTWKFAKTMPKCPHFYTMRKDSDPSEFEWFVLFIRQHGFQRTYFKKIRTYLEIDGWEYWTMGAPVEETILVNKAEVGAPAPGRGK
jgi:hypothetical protein